MISGMVGVYLLCYLRMGEIGKGKKCACLMRNVAFWKS